MTIKNKFISGVFWTSLEMVVNRGFGLIVQLVLARLLFPQDYGLIGMAAVFITFINVFSDLGMNAALVQRKEEEITPEHYDTVFWTGVVFSAILYLILLFIGTPLITQFYQEPLLAEIIPVISLGILLSPINMVHRAQLTKKMEFKKLAFISTTSSIVSGVVAISMAFTGLGVWALVFNSIAGTIISIPLFFKASKWLPRFVWQKKAFDDVFGFGAYTTGTSIFNYLMGNIDYLMIGKLLGTVTLGYYTFAFIITNTIRNQIVAIINKVAYPVYTTIQDDKRSMINLFLKIVSLNNLVVYPIIIALFIFGEFIIPIFFGNKWDNSIPLIRILCISVLIQMLNNSHTLLFRAGGKVRLELNLQIIKSICFYVPLISIGAYYYGVKGAALGYTLAVFLGVALSFYFMWKFFDLNIKEYLKALKSSLILVFIALPSTDLMTDILDWRMCLIYYFFVLILIYYLTAKKQILMLVSSIKFKNIK